MQIFDPDVFDRAGELLKTGPMMFPKNALDVAKYGSTCAPSIESALWDECFPGRWEDPWLWESTRKQSDLLRELAINIREQLA